MVQSIAKIRPTLLLCAERGSSLVESQAAVFRSAGYPVIVAVGPRGIREELLNSRYEIAVLNHTISFPERRGLTKHIRENSPKAGILVLHASGALGNPWADVAADSRRGVGAIFEALGRVEVLQAFRNHREFDFDSGAIAVVDAKRNYIFVSDDACHLLGYERAQFLELRIDDLVVGSTAATVPLFDDFIAQAKQSGQIQLRHRSGRIVSVNYEAEVRDDGAMMARWEPVESGTQPLSAHEELKATGTDARFHGK